MRALAPFSLIDEMDSLFNTVVGNRQWAGYDERGFNPPCDVTETEDHFLMNFEIPGINKDDLKIEANGNLLTVSGEKRNNWNKDLPVKTQRLERSYGFFKRSFTLPQGVEGDKIEAQYKDGVLSLYLPKSQAAKTRQIEVKSAENGFFGRLLNAQKI